MSTATLIPAGLSSAEGLAAAAIEAKRRSIGLGDLPSLPALPSPQLPPTSSAQTLSEKVSGLRVDEMVLAAAPHDCEAKHLHKAASTIGQMLLEV